MFLCVHVVSPDYSHCLECGQLIWSNLSYEV